MSIEGNKDIGTRGTKQTEDTGGTRVPADSSKGRLLRFLFCPPALGPLPVAVVGRDGSPSRPLSIAAVGRDGSPSRPLSPWLAVYPGGFAARLARGPVNLVTRLGITRSNAYYAAGCPLELCDHAAARDLWRVIYRDAIAFEPVVTPHAIREMEGLCR